MKKIQNKLKIFLIFCLIVFSISVAIKGTTKLLQGIEGQDFLYSPTKLFWEGVNHYEYIINQEDRFKKEKKILLSQNGEYAQFLYLIFYPFSLLSFEDAKRIWTFINLILIVLIPLILGKYLKLNNVEILISILFFLSSFPVRSTVNNGQQGLFILLFYCLPFIFKSNWISVLGGIAYAKYNLGITLFFYLLNNFKKLLLSLIPSIIGWLFYCYYTDTNLIKNIFQPIQLALTVTARPETVFAFIFNNNLLQKYPNLSYSIIVIELITCLILVLKINKDIKDKFYKLALIALTSITFFPHWGHDYIFLLPLALISYKKIENTLGKINIFFIAFFIYFQGYIVKFLKLINISYFDTFTMPIFPKLFLAILLLNLFFFKKFKFAS